MSIEPISDFSIEPVVRGYLHHPKVGSGDALVLTHGAGGNARSGLLTAIAESFAGGGLAVLRCDLPFRQLRKFGPPRPGDAARDRRGLANAILIMRRQYSGRIFLGGQSYGGRQASMLCAEENLAHGLVLLSYPLHPPGKPEQLRTQHLPQIAVPVMFVQGTHDPFGTIDEIEAARKLIPAKTQLLPIQNADHDLGFKGKMKQEDLPTAVLENFQSFFG